MESENPTETASVAPGAVPETPAAKTSKKAPRVKKVTAIKEMTPKEILETLVKKAKGMQLNQEDKDSRITFSNAHRVMALEQRKKFVLVHLPKKENLKDQITTVNENGKDVDHIGPFAVTYDSRAWSYIRVSRREEIDEAVKVIEYAKAHNA